MKDSAAQLIPPPARASHTDFFSSLTQNTWTLASLGKNIIAAATPKVVHSFVDSKLAVDKELKRVCEELILETSKKCAGAVQQFLLMVKPFCVYR